MIYHYYFPKVSFSTPVFSFNSTVGTISNVIGVTVEPNGFTINDIQGYALPVINAPVSITGLSITGAIGVIDPKDQVVGLPTFTLLFNSAIIPVCKSMSCFSDSNMSKAFKDSICLSEYL